MSPTLQFLRDHLNTTREPLLLGPAPIRVELEYAVQEVINAVADSARRAFNFLANLSPDGPFDPDIVITAELMTWGVPERPARWFVEQLPERVILHFAEMINR